MALEAFAMRKFLTELRGKTVMTGDGQILGMIDNFVVDTLSGGIAHVLVTPSEDVEQRPEVVFLVARSDDDRDEGAPYGLTSQCPSRRRP